MEIKHWEESFTQIKEREKRTHFDTRKDNDFIYTKRCRREHRNDLSWLIHTLHSEVIFCFRTTVSALEVFSFTENSLRVNPFSTLECPLSAYRAEPEDGRAFLFVQV